MIDAKRLAKHMKTAAKGGGYKLYEPADRGNLYIWTDLFCVVIAAAGIPRLVLATIVEQTGELPTPGICGIVTEGGLQTLLPEAAAPEVKAWTAEPTDYETCVDVKPIRYRGMLVYQSEDLNVYATNGAGLGIIDRSFTKRASAVDECRLFFTAPGECLILRCSRPANDYATPTQELHVWQALESCDLGAVE